MQAMKEVSAPVIGIALILSAVFVPVAFIGGLTGQMYQQFALTIAISVLLSAFSALSLVAGARGDAAQAGQAGARARSARSSAASTTSSSARPTPTSRGAQILVRRSILTHRHRRASSRWAPGLFGSALPAGFIPEEDQGILGVNVTLPPGASLERTSAVLAQVEKILGRDGGRRVVPDDRRLRRRHQHLPAELRHDLRAPEAVGRSATARRCTSGASCSASAPRCAASPRRSSSRSTSRRSRASAPRPASTSCSRTAAAALSVDAARRARAAVHGGRAQAPRDRQHLHLLRPALPAGQGRARPREGAQARGADRRGLPGPGDEPRRQLRQRLQPLRAPVPRLRPGRGRVPPQARGHRQLLGPQRDHGRHDPARRPSSRSRRVAGTEITNRFNLLRSVEFNGVPAPGYASGQALAALEEVFKETMPPEMGFAYSQMSYQEKIAPLVRPDLRRRDRVRVPAAGRAVRELAAALGRAARLAAGRAGRVLRRLARAASTTTSTCRSAASC